MVVKNTVKVGDSFRDVDKRLVDNELVRVVRVTEIKTARWVSDLQVAIVVATEHWIEGRIGRSSTIAIHRLENRRLFQKVSH